jgi:probable HAF family extracellular repeat protein
MNGSGMLDLGVLPGDRESKAAGINDAGQVIGSSTGSGGTRAFIWSSAGGMQSLGNFPGSTFTMATDINSFGQVVGTGATSLGTRAFFWSSSTGMIDLNALIPASSGIVLTSATGISDSGQIVALGTVNADTERGVELDDPHMAGNSIHVFVLTPM